MEKKKLARRPKEYDDMEQLNLGKYPKAVHKAIRAFAKEQKLKVKKVNKNSK